MTAKSNLFMFRSEKSAALHGFAMESAGVSLPQKKGDPIVFNADEYLNRKTNAEALQAINQNPLAVTTHPFDTRRGEQVGVPPAQASK